MKLKKDPAKYPCFNTDLKNLKGEKWREIPYTEGYYQVSNYGRVKALTRTIERNGYFRHIKERILSQSVSGSRNSYRHDYRFGAVVRFQFEGRKQTAMVRRLVYAAFVAPLSGKKMEGMRVYPLDGDGCNSHVSNLAIATRSALRKLDLSKGRFVPPAFLLDPEKNRKHLLKLNRKKRVRIKQYNLKGTLLREYVSITAASRKTGVSISAIWSSANGKTRHPERFIWRYSGENYDGKLPRSKTGKRPIVQYSITGKKIAIHPSINEAVRKTSIFSASICRCLKKTSRHAGGYLWRYMEGNS
ncbi:MAG TPA: NUMOD4 domain-containing protein [Puia sp.]|nr:NUMOD4 domain-containing protein [Puia sp.]